MLRDVVASAKLGTITVEEAVDTILGLLEHGDLVLMPSTPTAHIVEQMRQWKYGYGRAGMSAEADMYEHAVRSRHGF